MSSDEGAVEDVATVLADTVACRHDQVTAAFRGQHEHPLWHSFSPQGGNGRVDVALVAMIQFQPSQVPGRREVLDASEHKVDVVLDLRPARATHKQRAVTHLVLPQLEPAVRE